MASPPRPWPTSLLTVRRHTGTAVGTLGRQLTPRPRGMRTSSTRRINAHARSTIAHTGTHREKRTEKMWMCSGRSGNARALLHRQSAWQKGYFVLATQSARVLPPQLLCVCVGCFGVDARTWQRRRAATAPRRLHKKKTRRRRLAWPLAKTSREAVAWRARKRAHRRQALSAPVSQSLGPSVSLAGPDAQSSRSRPPGLSQSTRSPSARHHQSSPGAPVVCARAPPEPLPTRSSCSRAATTTTETAPQQQNSPRRGIVQRDWFARTSRPGGGPAARFLCGCAGKAGRRGGCGSPLALCGVQTSATGGGGGGDIRFGHAVPRTLPLVRCLTARRKEPGRQAGWLALATWPSRVAGFRFRFRRTCLAERGGGGRCASLLPGGVSRHRTPVWVLEYARHHPASGAS